jgi:hypothetical protein
MNRLGSCFLLFWVSSAAALGQQDGSKTVPVRTDPVPIYKVTVERRVIQAVNYGHRTEPTKIDFRGSVLLPKANGEAKVRSKAGAVEIDSKFENLEAPTRFGPEYLTYVLWAITPDGRPANLGEVLTDGSNEGKLKVTTQLQAFGLLVTAEPYFAVTQPSNVVVLENVLRPDTIGKVGAVEAKYELLSRGQSALAAKAVEIQPSSNEARNDAKAIPLNQYEAVLALYQAQNALQIARAQGAERYAADTLQKAEQLYQQAQTLRNDDKGESKRVVMMAREAAQTAEDARAIAMKRSGQEQPPQAQNR